MFQATRILKFCYGHRLMRYSGKCRLLHGHNATVEIELSRGRLDRRGMVRDFTEIKQAIYGWIEANLDHKMLLCKDDPAIAALRNIGEPLYIMRSNPTAEAIAKLIYDVARGMRLPVSAVRLWETDHSFATYRPSK